MPRMNFPQDARPTSYAIAVAATTCLLVACASSDDGGQSMSQGNQTGVAGSAANTADGSGGGTSGSGGSTTPASGSAGSAGMASGGQAGASGSGGAVAGASGMGAGSSGAPAAGSGAGGMAGGGTAGTGDGPDIDGPCTASEAASANPSGSGPHQVVVETNSDPGIKRAPSTGPRTSAEPRSTRSSSGARAAALRTVSRTRRPWPRSPRTDTSSSQTARRRRGGNRSLRGADAGKPLIAYIDWAIAENGKSCSAYYQSLETTKIAANGFSCGGLMAEGDCWRSPPDDLDINSSGLIQREPGSSTTRSTRRC